MSEFITFGNFDFLQIRAVDSFREYQDVFGLAKDWLGKRQSVLLYNLSDSDEKYRL